MAEKNRTKLDYHQDSTALVKAGLLFVAVKLGDLLDEIVVVGGVVPSLLVDQRTAGQQHVGTTDLDLALSLSVLSEEKYRDISGRLRDAGFAPFKKGDGKIVRQTWEVTGKLGRITVDFLIPRSDKADPKRLLQDLEKDFGAIRTRGLELAFIDRHRVDLDGLTIEGDRAKRIVQVAGLAAMLVLKAFAFDHRGAEKDAYDAFYLVHELGIDAAVGALGPYLQQADFVADITDALAILKRDFSDPDGIGAGSVARFMNEEADEDLRADVAGAIGAMVRRLGIQAS
jgi:hypothetical protein